MRETDDSRKRKERGEADEVEDLKDNESANTKEIGR